MRAVPSSGPTPGPAVPAGERTAADTAPWWPWYVARLTITDAFCIIVAVGVAYVVRFDVPTLVSGEYSPSYLAVSAVLATAWLAALAIVRSRDRRIIGTGPVEYARVFGATWRLFAVVAIVAYLLKMDIGRGYLAVAAPLGLLLILVSRYAWRLWLHRRRDAGRMQSGILVIGHREKAARLIQDLHRNPRAGYAVVGVCVPSGEISTGETVAGVPVLGSFADAARVAVATRASAVAVSGSDSITSDAVRQLGWDLEGSHVDLALTLSLVDVAGPRVTMQPVSGLPLMYVDEPRFTGAKYAAKTVFDWVGATAAVVVLSPLLALVAVAVACTSRGPVLYTQERIGRDGRRFRMYKFRSMVADAHDRLAEVLAAEGVTEIGLFYKPKQDPRVTRVGRFLRRFSLDELPQLFNVLRGEMSLVGPRPQIAEEVAHYDRTAHRRLLVKPGLTGLWQVSGRSDLSPEAGVRMDVSYVENWTLFTDLLILVRTAKVVLMRSGAY
ncbi:sugar transferase [Cellulomonas fimi]|uniref:Exopolysaccharide biosynthesis polyprenyl glycosylphosphotransferase n=1 Tax=Cellulomonas fimi (strain ATCC 484 / DSM 20113 / JCM 1341 / CCUG 24087 / LMG 16345 / NBRC 15513 / NCIMB 8980 / NCTC 7547 / NRS-133) TaxID=590998 RepID=F4GZE1_CELFA|nr:sugar transferase [Cellulomonas fimi]AEE44862.1 exopolysaccharide biosynthesis polyprenyl glycosylphosphotransferase [Cellulomonas fimi ATCC 484]NNH08097.1 sugar transferase [Cellulomonas fimi]VEH27514.1 Putative colanic biosynthesis UDP-glucose lipid carrier transferase [Cellulomonas fimi]